MNEPDPVDETTGIDRRDPRRCTATNRAGAPCGKFSMRGQNVCRAHGGASPQALAKAAEAIELAELRLRGLAPRAVAELESPSPAPPANKCAFRLRIVWSIDRSEKPPSKFRSRPKSWSIGPGNHPQESSASCSSTILKVLCATYCAQQ